MLKLLKRLFGFGREPAHEVVRVSAYVPVHPGKGFPAPAPRPADESAGPTPAPAAAPAALPAREPPAPRPARVDVVEPRPEPVLKGRGGRTELMALLDGKGHFKCGLTGREERILHEVAQRVEQGKLVLPHLPATSLAAMDMAARPSANLADIVQLIASDPVLSSELLKVANSAMYAGREEIETLREAIMRIGTRTLRSMILSVSMRAVMMRDKNLSEVASVVWRQSHSVGVICRKIASQLGIDGERAFVVGLLHDIGKVALLDTVRVCAKGDIVSPALLGRAFYFHHEHAGGEIAKAWKLPEEIVSVAGCHHAFEQNEGHGRAAAMVSFAHAVDLQLSSVGSFDSRDRLGEREMDYFGIAAENRGTLLALSEQAFDDAIHSESERLVVGRGAD